MFRPNRTPNRVLSTTYVLLSTGILVIAVPRLPRLSVNIDGVFAVFWIAFALVVLGANLWFALAADRERRLFTMMKVRRRRRSVSPDDVHRATGERLLR